MEWLDQLLTNPMTGQSRFSGYSPSFNAWAPGAQSAEGVGNAFGSGRSAEKYDSQNNSALGDTNAAAQQAILDQLQMQQSQAAQLQRVMQAQLPSSLPGPAAYTNAQWGPDLGGQAPSLQLPPAMPSMGGPDPSALGGQYLPDVLPTAGSMTGQTGGLPPVAAFNPMAASGRTSEPVMMGTNDRNWAPPPPPQTNLRDTYEYVHGLQNAENNFLSNRSLGYRNATPVPQMNAPPPTAMSYAHEAWQNSPIRMAQEQQAAREPQAAPPSLPSLPYPAPPVDIASISRPAPVEGAAPIFSGRGLYQAGDLHPLGTNDYGVSIADVRAGRLTPTGEVPGGPSDLGHYMRTNNLQMVWDRIRPDTTIGYTRPMPAGGQPSVNITSHGPVFSGPTASHDAAHYNAAVVQADAHLRGQQAHADTEAKNREAADLRALDARLEQERMMVQQEYMRRGMPAGAARDAAIRDVPSNRPQPVTPTAATIPTTQAQTAPVAPTAQTAQPARPQGQSSLDRQVALILEQALMNQRGSARTPEGGGSPPVNFPNLINRLAETQSPEWIQQNIGQVLPWLRNETGPNAQQQFNDFWGQWTGRNSQAPADRARGVLLNAMTPRLAAQNITPPSSQLRLPVPFSFGQWDRVNMPPITEEMLQAIIRGR